MLQITAPVQPGNSGGPILDDHARVIGVVNSKLDTIKAARLTGDIAQNVNFGIALPVLIDFLEKNKIEYVSHSGSKKKTPVEIAKEAQSFTYLVQCSEIISPSKQLPPPKIDKSPKPIGDRLTALIQIELNRLGYKVGIEDGLLGPKTRVAILRAQAIHSLPQTGLPSNLLLETMRAVR
jgi:S1-C subfamily serine protease